MTFCAFPVGHPGKEQLHLAAHRRAESAEGAPRAAAQEEENPQYEHDGTQRPAGRQHAHPGHSESRMGGQGRFYLPAAAEETSSHVAAALTTPNLRFHGGFLANQKGRSQKPTVALKVEKVVRLTEGLTVQIRLGCVRDKTLPAHCLVGKWMLAAGGRGQSGLPSTGQLCELT